MISDTGCDYLNENKQLQVGKRVMAYWCKHGFYYHGEGVITKLIHDKVSVQLQQRVARSDDYNVGKTIELPRISDGIHWSSRNCVRLIKKLSLPR